MEHIVGLGGRGGGGGVRTELPRHWLKVHCTLRKLACMHRASHVYNLARYNYTCTKIATT